MSQAVINPYLRIIDANFNRTKEALRVVEDFSRFQMNDKVLAGRIKKTRHAVSTILIRYGVSYPKILKTRESGTDVGKKNQYLDVKKPGAKEIVTANFKRAQESLRVLEELSKIIDPKSARKFQALRFEVYGIERKAVCGF